MNYRYSTLALFDNLGIEILGSQEDVTFQDLSFKVNLPGTKLGSFSIWGLGGKNTYTYRPLLEFGEWDYEDNEQQMGVAGLTNVAYLNKNTYLNTVVSYSLFDTHYVFDSLRSRALEDEEVVESVQLGVQSRFYKKGRFSPKMEKCVHRFHQIIDDFMT